MKVHGFIAGLSLISTVLLTTTGCETTVEVMDMPESYKVYTERSWKFDLVTQTLEEQELIEH